MAAKHNYENNIVRSRNNNQLQGTGDEKLDKAIFMAGYSYDATQDLFYSNMDPWQRHVGYCRLYDEAAAPLGMIIDAEPIYFEYQGKKWMIAFWKGQYDLVSGGEIGIYIEALQLKIPGGSRESFYQAANNDDRLQMSYTLKKNGNTFFTREGKHWWLTGFKLGEFCQPSELTMDVTITLHNEIMRDAFISGLRAAGYLQKDLKVTGNTVSFIFDVPHTPQPITRTPQTDSIIQKKNKLMCDKFMEITKDYDSVPDKIRAIEEQAPELYEKIIKMGKTKQYYERFMAVIMLVSVLWSRFTGGKELSKPSFQSIQ